MNRRGFALLEIIIVLGIAALLVSGGFYFNRLQSQKDTVQVGSGAIQKAKQVQQQIQTQVAQEGNNVNQLNSNSSSWVSIAVDVRVNFPIPTMYAKYIWNFASTTFENGFPVLYLYPEVNGDNLSPLGQVYDATNTDPSALAWEQMVASDTSGGPIGFYGGDGSFLTYYDRALSNAGYQSAPLNLDQTLNVTSESNPTYILGSLGADGPHGTVRGYIKYNQGKIRVIIISSSDTKNEIFISDVVSLQDLISPPIIPTNDCVDPQPSCPKKQGRDCYQGQWGPCIGL